MVVRIDLRLSKQEKDVLRHTADYFGMTMTNLIRQWISHDGPEGFLKEWRNRFA